MEKKEKLEDIEFSNDDYTRVRFRIVNTETFIKTLAEMHVPEGFKSGVNPYWDMILETTTVEKLKADRDAWKQRKEEARLIQEQKRASDKENEELRVLFNLKALFFKLPFAESEADKALIRKAPNAVMLDFAINELIRNYAKKRNLSIEQMFDLVEETMYNDD